MTFPANSVVTAEWREQLRQAVRDPDELIDLLGLPDSRRPGARRSAQLFPLVVPRPFLARMRYGDEQDPLLRQVLPLDAEGQTTAGFGVDPVGEQQVVRAPGLLQKYPGRALLMVAKACAVACRYCFRRHYPYQDGPAGLAEFEPAIQRIESDPSINELILSGGDPLMRSDTWLAELANRLAEIPHLRRLRVHSRLPIVIPSRINNDLIAWLTSSRLAPTFVVHANHPAEIDSDCGAALLRLVKAGVPVLNQSVLLQDINDDVDVLTELSERLLDVRVLPYYLHQLDPVSGAAHFEVPIERGLRLVAAMQSRLPGFGVPRYVQEVAGAAHKKQC